MSTLFRDACLCQAELARDLTADKGRVADTRAERDAHASTLSGSEFECRVGALAHWHERTTEIKEAVSARRELIRTGRRRPIGKYEASRFHCADDNRRVTTRYRRAACRKKTRCTTSDEDRYARCSGVGRHGAGASRRRSASLVNRLKRAPGPGVARSPPQEVTIGAWQTADRGRRPRERQAL